MKLIGLSISTCQKTDFSNGNHIIDRDISPHATQPLIIPITLVYRDSLGRFIQLFKTQKYGLIGSVLDQDNHITIITGEKIINPLCPRKEPEKLVEYLENIELKQWDIVYDTQTVSLTIWPHLVAAGKNGVDGHKKHLTYRDLNAAKRELKGEVVCRKTNGVPYDHVNEVRDSQRGLLKIINKNNKQLSESNLDHSKREEITKELSKASKLLDHSEKFVGNLTKTPANKNFEQRLQQTKLTESYNPTHRQNPVQAKAGTGGEIGGVACSTDYIDGLFDSVESLLEQDHFFCLPKLPNGKMPFTDNELKQILRELAIGVYTHSTIPFFSLHFNQNSDQFPIIHPAYENTLVGRVIGLLDYFMKGYLNGGIFQEDFIDKWAQDPNWKKKSTSALQNLIDFESYCKNEKNKMDEEDQEYRSLRQYQLMSGLGLNDFKSYGEELIDKIGKSLGLGEESTILEDFSGFRSSFRIIAKQNSIQKEGNVFVIDADFDVLYTMNPSPEYQDALEQYLRKNGTYPLSYIKLEQTYQLISKKIHDHMVKMPLCRDYFAMLSVINFFSGYFSTLKKHRKIPVLPVFKVQELKGCPALFPHLPIKKTASAPLKLNSHLLFKKLFANSQSKIENFLTRLLDDIIQSETSLFNSLNDYRIDEMKDLLSIFETYFNENVLEESGSLGCYIVRELDSVLPMKKVNINKLCSQLRDSFLQFFIKSMELIKTELVEIRQDSTKKSKTNKELVSEFLTFYQDQIPNESENITLPIPFNITRVKSEISSSELEKGKRVVGGCGMALKVQTVQSSVKASRLLINNYSKMLSLKPESWEEVSFDYEDKSKGFMFRLLNEDVPAWISDDYAWMESLSLITEEENDDLIEMRIKILEAISSEDQTEFSNLIDQAKDLDKIKDRYGRTLMHHAAMKPDPFYVKLLLEKKVFLSKKDMHGYLPIHYAAMTGALKNMQCLFEGDKSSEMLNAVSRHGTTPLMVSIQHNQLDATRWLIEKGAVITTDTGGYNTLHCALHQGNEDIILEVLNHKDISKTIVNEMSEEGGTPLMMACELDSLKFVEMLLKLWADPAAKRKDGVTAGEIAIKRNNTEILSALLKHTTPSGHAIVEAAKNSTVEIVELCMSRNRKSFFDYKNACKDTALHISIREVNIPVATYIIEQTIDTNYLGEANEFGETPFSIAVSLGIWRLVLDLLKKNAVDTKELIANIPNLLRQEYHPHLEKIFDKIKPSEELLQESLSLAIKYNNYLAISQLLIPRGVDVDKLKGPNGWTIMHDMAKADGIFLFKSRILKAKDILQTTEDGKTLPYIAAENQSRRVLKLLLKLLKEQQISLDKHFKDRHLFYPVVEAGNEECLTAMLEAFPGIDLVNTVLDDEDTYPVHLAAKIGSESFIRLFADKKANLDVKDKQNFTPLYYAVRAGAKKVVTYLINDGKVTITPHALYAATSGLDPSLLSLLIESNRISQQAKDGALLLAIYDHDKIAFEKLRQLGATFGFMSKKTGWDPILKASASGQHEILEVLLKDKTLKKSTFLGDNPLHLACKNDHPQCVRLLLEAGYKNEEGLTAKDLAKGNTVIVALLEDKKMPYQTEIADFLSALKEVSSTQENMLLILFKEMKDFVPDFLKKQFSSEDDSKLNKLMDALPINKTLLFEINDEEFWGTLPQYLIKISQEKDVTALLEKIVNDSNLKLDRLDSEGNTLVHLLLQINILPPHVQTKHLTLRNHRGETPIHVAAAYAKPERLKKLLELDKDSTAINCVDRQGRTPIFHALREKREENIQVLINCGANLNHYTYTLETPLFSTYHMKSLKLFQALINGGADINQEVLTERLSPLYLTITSKQDEMTHQLLVNGVKCNIFSPEGIHPVHLVAKFGSPKLIRLMHAKDFTFAMKDNRGFRPIHYAVTTGKIETVATILSLDHEMVDLPIELKETTKNKMEKKFDLLMGATPLHLSALYSNLDIMNYLLKWNANIATLTENNLGVLSFAALSQSKSTVELLYRYKLSNDHLAEAVIGAITNDNLDAMISLYKHGLIVTLDLVKGVTGLHIASKYGSLQCTQWLLQNGADPWEADPEGKDSFELSAANKSFEQFKLLIEYADPDLDQPKRRGATLAHIAAEADNLNHLILLLKLGASFDLGDNSEQTPLHHAIKKKRHTIVELLLACGASLKTKNIQGKGALDLVEKEDSQTKKIIEIHQKALQNAKEGDSHLHLAVRNKQTHAVFVLIDLEDIDQQNSEGSTALHLAVQTKQMKTIIRLVDAGGDLDIPDNQGKTPLWYACFIDFAMAKFLADAGANVSISDNSDISLVEAIEKSDLPWKTKLLEYGPFQLKIKEVV
jgi:ankyrin repeat protein